MCRNNIYTKFQRQYFSITRHEHHSDRDTFKHCTKVDLIPEHNITDNLPIKHNGFNPFMGDLDQIKSSGIRQSKVIKLSDVLYFITLLCIMADGFINAIKSNQKAVNQFWKCDLVIRYVCRT
jgi:hypothetical protein